MLADFSIRTMIKINTETRHVERSWVTRTRIVVEVFTRMCVGKEKKFTSSEEKGLLDYSRLFC